MDTSCLIVPSHRQVSRSCAAWMTYNVRTGVWLSLGADRMAPNDQIADERLNIQCHTQAVLRPGGWRASRA